MSRFVLGAMAGVVFSLSLTAGVGLIFPPQAKAPVVEAKVEPQAPQPAPELTPEAVAEARSAFGDLLAKAISPVIDMASVSDAEAVRSASFAEAMRQATGAVPDTTAEDASSLINLSSAGSQMREVKPDYFTVWDDLMQRCYDTVALAQPMNEDGLTAKGEERIDYAQAYSEQVWFSADKAFSIKIKTRSGDGRTGILRTCVLETNRFARVEKDVTGQLKDRFHTWWARERLEIGTEAQEYPYTLSDNHRWYGGLTRFGSAQGCPLKVEFSEITIGRETDAKLFLTETDRNGCTLAAGTGPGGKVRVNRLPQMDG